MTYGKVHTDGSRSGGQPVEPKLLTEADTRVLRGLAQDKDSADAIDEILRGNGLIALEPVDPLKEEARILAAHLHSQSKETIALAALKRGMELARPELTREMVRDAFAKAYIISELQADRYYQATVDRIHAALTEQVRP